MTADLQKQAYETGKVLYMALELSAKKWRVAFSEGRRRRQKVLAAGSVAALCEEMRVTKEKWGLGAEVSVVSCYEAGRDGFWLHRELEALGVENHVVDAASIEVSRRARRAKTDRLDVEALLAKLMRYCQGERRVWRTVRVPAPEWEDRRQLLREREQLKGERTRHRNRLRSKLVAQGLDVEVDRHFVTRLEAVRGGDGRGELPVHLKAGLLREWARLEVVERQLAELERHIRAQMQEDPLWRGAQALGLLRGVGWVGATQLWAEMFAWRGIRNRRELAALAGLAPTPYASGAMEREQGVGKSGNPRIRALLIELAWLWLRYQPESKHSRWFQERFGGGSRRLRRIGIVALARRLLVDLWRFVDAGVVPEGAKLKSARLKAA
jgi:transposase